MENNTQYMIMTDEDLDEFIVFLRKNQYYFLKHDIGMKKEQFVDLQKKRGYMFSVVTKNKGKIVAHIAAYRGGGQKICKKHQVFLSTMVIDKGYRNAMFSIPFMYSYMMQELTGMGYTDILCECGESNMTSLRMIRKFGGIMLDAKTEMYHNYLMHNYLLGIGHLSGPELIETTSESFSFLPVIKRQFAVQGCPVVENRYIWQDFHFNKNEVSVCINIHTGYVCGLKIHEMLSIIPSGNSFDITYFPCGKENVELIIWKDEKRQSERVLSTKKEDYLRIKIDGSFNKIQWINHNNGMNFVLYPAMDKTAPEVTFVKLADDLWFEKSTGKLRFFQENEAKICEMLPSFTYPYNIGYLQPEERTISIEKEQYEYVITQQTDTFVLKRRYHQEGTGMKISTQVKFFEDAHFEPLFNIFMEDLSYHCEIHLLNGEIVEKESDFARDNATGNEEVIFADFRKEPYSKEPIAYILLHYNSVDIKIEMQKRCRCFHQYNYIGIVPIAGWNEEKIRCLETGEFINLGDIYISKI